MAHRYRFRPDPSQVQMLARHCRHARYVWNLALERESTGQPAGVDMGVAATVTLSTGECLQAPALRPGDAQRLRRLQRKSARQ